MVLGTKTIEKKNYNQIITMIFSLISTHIKKKIREYSRRGRENDYL